MPTLIKLELGQGVQPHTNGSSDTRTSRITLFHHTVQGEALMAPIFNNIRVPDGLKEGALKEGALKELPPGFITTGNIYSIGDDVVRAPYTADVALGATVVIGKVIARHIDLTCDLAYVAINEEMVDMASCVNVLKQPPFSVQLVPWVPTRVLSGDQVFMYKNKHLVPCTVFPFSGRSSYGRRCREKFVLRFPCSTGSENHTGDLVVHKTVLGTFMAIGMVWGHVLPDVIGSPISDHSFGPDSAKLPKVDWIETMSSVFMRCAVDSPEV